MFGKQFMFRLVVAIVAASSIAVVGARTARGGSSYSPSAYVYGGASAAVSQAIQSAGFGSNRAVATARRKKTVPEHGLRLITDTLGGDGQLRTIPGLGGHATPV